MSAMDGLEETSARAKLVYPLGEAPLGGCTIQAAPGVLWLRMPLPFALKWINLYLIEDGAGWALIDTGIATEESRVLWRALFEGTLQGRPITRVICTHMHPDHIGLAGWITRKFSCRLWMTRLEYFSCRMLVADTGREAPEDGVDFYRAAGWDQETLDRYRARFGGFGKAVSRLPDSYRRIQDGEIIRIGGEDWQVITGCGHSPEHACLLRLSDNVFISGDQVLPRISSNVSVFPTEPEADPLSDWIASCHKLLQAVPPAAFTLPAHNEPFFGLHHRLQGLIESHDRSLDRLAQRLQQEPRRVIDCFGALFARSIGPDLIGMASGEALAHLNCLIGQGRAARTLGPDGIALYAAI